jgi:hypothetical protein
MTVPGDRTPHMDRSRLYVAGPDWRYDADPLEGLSIAKVKDESAWGLMDRAFRAGRCLVTIECDRPDKAIYSADDTHFDRRSGKIYLSHPNSYVLTGVNNALAREFGLGGVAVGYIGIDNDSSAVSFTTQYLHGSSAGTQPTNQIIEAISPAAVVTAGTAATQAATSFCTGGATFLSSAFTSGVFIINKIGFLTASTDAGQANQIGATGVYCGTLIDVVGGTGGSAPYTRTFSINLTSAGTFTLVAQIASYCVPI